MGRIAQVQNLKKTSEASVIELRGWRKEKLHKLGFLGRGKSKHRPRNDISLFGGNYPFIQTGDVKAANFYISEFSQTYNEKGLSQSKLWKKGTLCITIAANIAETGILGIDACFPDSIVGFVADPKLSNAKFIKYYIDTIKKQMSDVSQGATQENLSLEKIGLFDLLIPPIETQQKIVGILSAYDDLIENNNRRIKILEEMAQKLYKEWFVDFRFPGHQNTKFIDSALGKIPEGWTLGRLKDVCQVIPGYAFKNKDWQVKGVPVIKIKNIRADNTIDHAVTDFVSEEIFQKIQTKFILNHGDFLVAMTGATAGKVGKLRTNKKMLLNQRVAKLSPSELLKEFIWCSISTDEAKRNLYSLADGAAQPNMSGAQIESVELLYPTQNLIEHFSSFAKPILEQSDNLYLKNQTLRQTRDLLLPHLISGELSVENLEVKI